jgi:dTDP-4-amino-4,6-dideoxygalactose transaminase
MNIRDADFAIASTFAEAPLLSGQHNLPAWERYETAMRGIFERQWYTNQGPLAREFEERLQTFLGVQHAVVVTNATIGLLMACEALQLSGKRILLPALRNMAVDHAVAWCGIQPVLSDVDATTGHIALPSATPPVDGILAANLWGGGCDRANLAAWAAERDLPLLFDSMHGFGCEAAPGRRLGALGNVEVFAFDDAQMLNAGGGACVTTDDDLLAARLRNIRSSYGAGHPVPVVKTSNGRLSEAQAALGLLGIEDFDANRARNAALFKAYQAGLSNVRGVRVIEPVGVTGSNYQSLVCAVDAEVHGWTRDALVGTLQTYHIHAHSLPVSPIAVPVDMPVAAHIAASWMMLPLGAHVSEADVQAVCALIRTTVDAPPHMDGDPQ